MNYILWTLIFLALGLGLSYVSVKKGIPDNWVHTVNFLIAAFGTFIGVFLGVYVSDIEQKVTNRQQMDRLLSTAYYSLKAPPTNQGLTGHESRLMGTILVSDFVIENMSPDSFVKMFESQDRLMRAWNALTSTSDSSIASLSPQTLRDQVRQEIITLQKLLAIEIAVQTKVIAANQVELLHQLLSQGKLDLKAQGIEVPPLG